MGSLALLLTSVQYCDEPETPVLLRRTAGVRLPLLLPPVPSQLPEGLQIP